MKYKILIITALAPLFVLANTLENIDEPVSDFSAAKSVEVNKFYLKYVDIDSGRWISNPLTVEIDKVSKDDVENYSITDGEIFQSAKNSNPSGYITVSAQRKLSQTPLNWLNAAMAQLRLSHTDIVNTEGDRPDDVNSFPKKLDFAFQTTLYLYPPKTKEIYRCEDVIIAEGSFGTWWMAGNTPNPSVNQSGILPYQKLPVLECSSTTSSSTLKAYIGATLNAVGSNIMILNYRIKNN
jgi:hypothetical protein